MTHLTDDPACLGDTVCDDRADPTRHNPGQLHLLLERVSGLGLEGSCVLTGGREWEKVESGGRNLR